MYKTQKSMILPGSKLRKGPNGNYCIRTFQKNIDNLGIKKFAVFSHIHFIT